MIILKGLITEGKIIKVKKDPFPVSNWKGPRKFNGLKDLKGKDKIAWLTWMGSNPQGKGSYELDGKRLNVNGINPRDKGFYVSHFTKNTGIRKNNLYYDGTHWTTHDKKFNEGKLTEAVGQYAVNVQDTRKNKQIQSGHFTLKDDAKLYIKDMMKKHKLTRQKGFWGNPKTGVEMLTNF